MLTVIMIIVAYYLVPVVLRLVIEMLATAIGIVAVIKADRAKRAMLSLTVKCARGESAFDRPTSAAERRVLREGLKSAMRMTDLTSLFPDAVHRAQRRWRDMIPDCGSTFSVRWLVRQHQGGFASVTLQDRLGLAFLPGDMTKLATE